ncbi:precorrin-6A reductase [Effusibacillus lacus]|uniref:Precorrin-6A reductase n=1 Tax=Effusibacillus lacus TaxID=1348429 RepID=A0A292YE41_9BACL|nr:precorrin-6A reductase [Effusibacillus lacus]TCS75712.1 cobalt-precorrin 6A reductase [Effusibacillus lacus]GAX91032.1 precorrin-6A reductase [Effusibacillus lacus]
MILFLAGTSDARELAIELQAKGYRLLVSVVTESAAESLKSAGLDVSVGRKTSEEMAEIIRRNQISAIVDASHPFAEIASQNAMEAANSAGIPYYRYERPGSILSDHPLITYVRDYREAAEVALERKGTIFLTTGSKTLHIFAEVLNGVEGIRMIARMLPNEENMRKCAELGIPQKNIVAMQGPFSEELNQAFYRHYGVSTVITKESGAEGSVQEKVKAALDNNVQVIVICRPGIDYGRVYESSTELIEALEEVKRDEHLYTQRG